MPKLAPIAAQLSRAKWLPTLAILLILAVLGATIWLDTARLRHEVRTQLIQHDGEVLLAVARAEQAAEAQTDPDRSLANSAGQLALALKLSNLKEGVLGVRLFDSRGRSVLGLPLSLKGANLSGDDIAAVRAARPMSRFLPKARLEEFFLVDTPRTPAPPVPLHLVLIPIQNQGQTNLLPAAQLILDGHALAAEFARLDRKLLFRSVIGFLLTGGVAVLGLVGAFGYQQKLNRRLQEQAARLRRANQELALAAKTSALGAVTAHLVHGLTSPLAGLQEFVATRAAADAESQDALRSARRMQALLDETVRVLSDANGATAYELPVAELVEVLDGKIRPLAEVAGVQYSSKVQAQTVLSNRAANLVALILENLLHNAIEATPRGKTVRLDVEQVDHALRCQVRDQGPGLPEAVQRNLFTPGRSTKPGGHGLGLAIGQQLARHLGAELQLERSSEEGCVFSLMLPVE